MRPVLEVARSEEIKFSDAVQKIAESLGLSDEDQNELLPSGTQTVFSNRVGWAKTYLVKARLLEPTRRGYFVITKRGKDTLSDQSLIIDKQYLKKFEEFREFLGKKNSSDESGEVDNEEAKSETPDEALRTAYQQINDALISEVLSRTRQVSPAYFERILLDLLLAMGYGGSGEGAAHVLGRSGDNGIDGLINQDPLGVDQVYIQAKRYSEGNNVGSSDVRDFFGALNIKRAQKGIFVTTSDFTSSALQTTKDLGSRIVLINGSQLAKLMVRYSIGCRSVNVLHLKKVDESFFED